MGYQINPLVSRQDVPGFLLLGPGRESLRSGILTVANYYLSSGRRDDAKRIEGKERTDRPEVHVSPTRRVLCRNKYI